VVVEGKEGVYTKEAVRFKEDRSFFFLHNDARLSLGKVLLVSRVRGCEFLLFFGEAAHAALFNRHPAEDGYRVGTAAGPRGLLALLAFDFVTHNTIYKVVW